MRREWYDKMHIDGSHAILTFLFVGISNLSNHNLKPQIMDNTCECAHRPFLIYKPLSIYYIRRGNNAVGGPDLSIVHCNVPMKVDSFLSFHRAVRACRRFCCCCSMLFDDDDRRDEPVQFTICASIYDKRHMPTHT